MITNSIRQALLDALDAVPRDDAVHEREWGNAFFADWQRERDRADRAEGRLLNFLAAWEHCGAPNVCDHCKETARQAYELVDVSEPALSADADDAVPREEANAVAFSQFKRAGELAARAERAERERDALRADNERLREAVHDALVIVGRWLTDGDGDDTDKADLHDRLGAALSADAEPEQVCSHCGIEVTPGIRHQPTPLGAVCNWNRVEPSRAEGEPKRGHDSDTSRPSADVRPPHDSGATGHPRAEGDDGECRDHRHSPTHGAVVCDKCGRYIPEGDDGRSRAIEAAHQVMRDYVTRSLVIEAIDAALAEGGVVTVEDARQPEWHEEGFVRAWQAMGRLLDDAEGDEVPVDVLLREAIASGGVVTVEQANERCRAIDRAWSVFHEESEARVRELEAALTDLVAASRSLFSFDDTPPDLVEALRRARAALGEANR